MAYGYQIPTPHYPNVKPLPPCEPLSPEEMGRPILNFILARLDDPEYRSKWENLRASVAAEIEAPAAAPPSCPKCDGAITSYFEDRLDGYMLTCASCGWSEMERHYNSEKGALK